MPLGQIATLRRETRFTHGKKDNELNLPIGSPTSLTLNLTEPVTVPTCLGSPRPIQVIRLHADDPTSLYDAVTQARTTSTPAPGTRRPTSSPARTTRPTAGISSPTSAGAVT
ncbi:hypothetical protein ABZ721_14935 [Streptomyces sp. NPDC006733]|uniref:hypothetical protein n=1 Tax=Streptomyces sp. NPDC006733 TaxID=3155460 RepID=UPI0033DDEA89